MAETKGVRPLKKAHPSNSLNYGHFGTATYFEKSHEWRFLREQVLGPSETGIDSGHGGANAAFPFKLLPEYSKIIVDSTANQHTESGERVLPLRVPNLFVKRFPELVPGLSRVSMPLLSTSRFTEGHEASSSNVAERLAFGSAVWLSEKEGKGDGVFVPIAAIGAGINAQSIKIVRIGRQKVTVDNPNDSTDFFVIPSISKQDEAWWTGSGERVDQICFAAESGASSTWMAVRQRSCTTLLHPLLHRQPVAARYATAHNIPPHPSSLLDCNPALALPNSRTGGFPHADVAFHPQDHRTLAVVDEHGNWSVWRLEGRGSETSRVLFRIHLQFSGKVHSWEFVQRPMHIDPYYDGWHRVNWFSNSATATDKLLVCNRQLAAVHGTDAKFQGLVNLRMGPIKEGQWILDVKRSAANETRCFILTSTRLLVMSTAGEDWTDSESLEALSVKFCWQHFRTRADSTMQLALAETPQSSNVFIYSRTNGLVTAFRFGADFETSPLALSIIDPVHLTLPRGISRNQENPFDVGLTFRIVQVRRTMDYLVEPEEMTFLKLFIQHADLQLSEAVFQCTDKDLMGSINVSTFLALRLPVARALKPKSQKYAELDEIYDFVEDRQIIGQAEDLETLDLVLTPPANPRNVSSAVWNDWEDIYDLITPADDLISPSQRIELPSILKWIQRHMRSMVGSSLPIVLFSEAAKETPYIPDVEEASVAFTDFLQTLQEEAQNKVALAGLEVPHERIGQGLTLVELYNYMFAAWVTSLPSEFPDRVRVNRERLARNVAADLVFAGRSMRREIQSQDLALNDAPQSGPAFHDSGLADNLSAKPGPSSSPTTAKPINASFLRLSTLAKFTKPTTAVRMTATMTEILAHLPMDITTDPATYSWRATELSLAAAQEDQARLQQDPRIRRRAEKAAEILRRKLEAQNKVSQALRKEQDRAVPMVLDTQQMPVEMHLPVREVQSSQIAPPSSSQAPVIWPQVSMTQPERGVFGGHTRSDLGKNRRGKAKAREGRKAGF